MASLQNFVQINFQDFDSALSLEGLDEKYMMFCIGNLKSCVYSMDNVESENIICTNFRYDNCALDRHIQMLTSVPNCKSCAV